MHFTAILGHDKQKKILSDIVKEGNFAPAYAFLGPSGIGKKKTALAFSKMANCLEPDLCHLEKPCRSCHKIETGNHPDIIYLGDGLENIKIDDIRKTLHSLAYAPFEARQRFFLIDNAHNLTQSSSNALLKTLEDCASHTSFILLAQSASKLLPTIVSRCQKINFSALSQKDVESILEKVLGHSDIKLLVRLSQGSLERALELKDTLLSCEKRIHILKQMSEKHPVEWIGELSSLELFFLKTWYRDILLSMVCPGSRDQIIHEDLKSLIQVESEKSEISDVMGKWSLVMEAERRLEFNVNKQINNEWLGLQLV
ncbi:MAG: hypothetical protein HYS98_04515 [Deltaproteobacteria bacterium]|nr:hypothetical protein [Deltaproteobacteria bacterium]